MLQLWWDKFNLFQNLWFSMTVFEYSESEYCSKSKVGFWIFYHSKATKVIVASQYLPLNWEELGYKFLSHELQKIKEILQSWSHVFARCFPNLGEFSNYKGPLTKRNKESSRISKSSNYRGIPVRIIQVFLSENFEGKAEFC